ncbi:HAUS augmin-like complex subunit 6 N-terminus-domain-containing protein [Massariosphaeria phaeospora]|uniref:HAUS augmin-like complex subunit 6 N-terminus-domain-containing protein n=1 Tax=Massariosphaeria phaeospora TaxID=100035 RepID=A0A7C8IQF1_9PLEO|nr:HAUS augmin-like complex subunit 6 N-terminus-domain-containing protein [Massariosphaeria phaeospora]
MSRTTSQSSTATATATTTTSTGLSRSISVKTNTTTGGRPAHNANPLPVSDVKLFVTNLRLLDLDRRPDWPNITAQTFSSKTADQKQRIGGVEWALFSLFELWDPTETSQKLQPFFPPLEPLQSLNLRAALYRSLGELKKNGVLGRESVLRKTMLDECKGDKFFEALALFSTAVLKKVLASRSANAIAPTAVARKLATATELSKEQQASLLPLAIAHKGALLNVLRKKDEKRRRFAEFEALLDAKADEINRKLRQSKDTPRTNKSAVPLREAEAIKKQLQDNWIGNQKWLDVMLHGDSVQVEDAFLDSSFDRVWYMVERGRKLEDAAPEAGLLENLQSRVQEQQTRLQKWQRFHQKLCSDKSISAVPQSRSQSRSTPKEFKFDHHLQYQLQSPSSITDRITQKPSLRPQYDEIVSELDAELDYASKAKYNRAARPQLPRRRTSSLGAPPISPARNRKMRSDSRTRNPVSPARPARPAQTVTRPSLEKIPILPRPHEHARTPVDSDATLLGVPSTALRTAAPPSSLTDTPAEQDLRLGQEVSEPVYIPSSPPTEPYPVQPTSTSPPPTPHISSEPPPLLDPEPQPPTEDLADQIITSISAATPSPVKKPAPKPRLSLLERTRMSMAPTTTFDPIAESPPLPPSPPPEPIANPAAAASHPTSLAERTRLSMAAMASNPRVSLAPREKRGGRRRTSTFPVNQFDTPRSRKSVVYAIDEADAGGASADAELQRTPKEVLFSDEVDYERVFKSRPKVATSPVFGSPGGGSASLDGCDALNDDDGEAEDAFDEGVTGVDLADVDAADELYEFENGGAGDGFAWDNSPLRRVGQARTGATGLFS